MDLVRNLDRNLGIKVAIISNGDSRMSMSQGCSNTVLTRPTAAVLKDLEFPDYIDPILISEELGIEKPAAGIFQHALDAVNARMEVPIAADECLHVGDELIWWDPNIIRRQVLTSAATTMVRETPE